MGIARGLFLAVAGAIACSIPWQDTANLDGSAPLPGSLSITPTGGSGPNGTPSPAPASSSAGASPDIVEPAPAPEIATLTPRTALGSRQPTPSLTSDRSLVARDLQRELTRVGCYDGEVHGVWTPATRRAMKAFVDRVNAALPTEEPDYILLSLVQAARDKVCGASCPAGQGLADGGRCVPNAILAGKKAPQVARAGVLRADPAAAITGWSVTRTATGTIPPSASDPARVGLADPSAQAWPPGAAPNAPAQSPTTVTAPGAPRSADAKRAAAQPTFLGLSIFKQLDKLGF